MGKTKNFCQTPCIKFVFHLISVSDSIDIQGNPGQNDNSNDDDGLLTAVYKCMGPNNDLWIILADIENVTYGCMKDVILNFLRTNGDQIQEGRSFRRIINRFQFEIVVMSDRLVLPQFNINAEFYLRIQFSKYFFFINHHLV